MSGTSRSRPAEYSVSSLINSFLGAQARGPRDDCPHPLLAADLFLSARQAPGHRQKALYGRVEPGTDLAPTALLIAPQPDGGSRCGRV